MTMHQHLTSRRNVRGRRGSTLPRQSAAVMATAGGVEGALGTKPASVAGAGEGMRTRTLPRTGTVREPLDKHAADRQVYSKVLANRSAGASGTTAVTRVLVTLPGMCVHEL